MKKFLCTAMATLVAVAAMAVGLPRNTKAPTYQVKTSHVGKLQHKQQTSFGKLLPKLSASDLRKAPTLKAVPDAMWAAFTMGLEDIEDPGIYSFHLANQFAMGEKIIGNAKVNSSLFTNATASVVGDNKVFLSSWYGYAAIYDLATGETLMETGTEALGNIFYSACYDKESKLVYGAFFNSSATGLEWCSYDLNTHVKTVIADVSMIHPAVAANYGVDAEIYTAEISFDALYASRSGIPVYQPLPKFPAVTRDIAVVCAEEVTVGALEDCIRRGAKGLLKNVTLFDIYRGPGIAEGKKSVAFSLVLRADDRSLTSEEADADMKSILALLESELDAHLR